MQSGEQDYEEQLRCCGLLSPEQDRRTGTGPGGAARRGGGSGVGEGSAPWGSRCGPELSELKECWDAALSHRAWAQCSLLGPF